MTCGRTVSTSRFASAEPLFPTLSVPLTLNNVSYQATVENGIWAVQVPVSDVLNLANTLYTVSVSGTDSVGNSGSAEANLLVDTVLP
ncbi:hypothetical protein, partial [Enterobacter asburiae]|uniref:hypothetical protein n=1 Tax=Enterobacter asburiae TaxID=61645 RepID=UPI0012DAADE2